MKHPHPGKLFFGALCVLLSAMFFALYQPIFRIARPGDLIVVEDQPVPLAGGTRVLRPSAPGTVTFENPGAVIDVSNVSEGYIMVKYTGGSGKIKVQITRSGGKTYTYDLRSDGSYETLPLTSGDGRYTVSVFKNVGGSTYARVLDGSTEVKLRDPLLPFLYPSQYVNFDADSRAVKKSEELAKDVATDLQIVEKVYDFVITHVTYDEQKAATVKSGYLPVVDDTLATGKGICFDYAVLMTAMLRAQQIPTRLEIGYVSGGAYHAWISVFTKETGWIHNAIQFDGKTWKLMDPTFASGGQQSESVMKYIGNGSNYTMQYCY